MHKNFHQNLLTCEEIIYSCMANIYVRQYQFIIKLPLISNFKPIRIEEFNNLIFILKHSFMYSLKRLNSPFISKAQRAKYLIEI